MINNERIVPITKVDLLSAMWLMHSLIEDAGEGYIMQTEAATPAGIFNVTAEASTATLLNEPAKEIYVTAKLTSEQSCVIYFVPTYDFKGVSLNGGALIKPEGMESIDLSGCDVIRLHIDGEIGMSISSITG